MILDIHTHREAPCPQAIVSTSPEGFDPVAGQLYSVGIHPWDTDGDLSASLALLRRVAASDQAAAIGECGLDTLRGGPMFRQLQTLRECIDVSESTGKPLIIHCVRAWDAIIGLHGSLHPGQPWIVHGFRGKPQLARMLVEKGIMISFGEKFNSETPLQVPRNMIFAETDMSSLPIEEVIRRLSAACGEDLTGTIAANVRSIFPQAREL